MHARVEWALLAKQRYVVKELWGDKGVRSNILEFLYGTDEADEMHARYYIWRSVLLGSVSGSAGDMNPFWELWYHRLVNPMCIRWIPQYNGRSVHTRILDIVITFLGSGAEGRAVMAWRVKVRLDMD